MRQNPLHTLLLLKDLAQRQRSDAGLNKGEGRNALARTAFFNRLGEIHDRNYEHQRSRASGLIWSGQRSFCGIRCIWNAVEAMHANGIEVPADFNTHLSPLRWGHINLRGVICGGRTPPSSVVGRAHCGHSTNAVSDFLGVQFWTNR